MLLIVDEPVECFESVLGYEAKFRPPLGYARTTPENRHSRPNFRFFGFSSAVASAPDSQDSGADGPNVTVSGQSLSCPPEPHLARGRHPRHVHVIGPSTAYTG